MHLQRVGGPFALAPVIIFDPFCVSFFFLTGFNIFFLAEFFFFEEDICQVRNVILLHMLCVITWRGGWGRSGGGG